MCARVVKLCPVVNVLLILEIRDVETRMVKRKARAYQEDLCNIETQNGEGGLSLHLPLPIASHQGAMQSLQRKNRTTTTQNSQIKQSQNKINLHLFLCSLHRRFYLPIILRPFIRDMHMRISDFIKLWRSWYLACKLLECLALGLRDKQGGENTNEHEKGINLHYVVQPWASCGTRWCTSRAQWAD